MFLWGSLQGEKLGLEHDPELLYVGAMFHDVGLQVIAVNGRPYHARSLQDTVPLPVGGEVRIRMRFRDYLGAFVYHCHILAHEDDGMMGVVEVTRTGRHPSARTLRELRNMHAAMTMAGHHSHLAHP